MGDSELSRIDRLPGDLPLNFCVLRAQEIHVPPLALLGFLEYVVRQSTVQNQVGHGWQGHRAAESLGLAQRETSRRLRLVCALTDARQEPIDPNVRVNIVFEKVYDVPNG